jgi:hypothetical protein
LAKVTWDLDKVLFNAPEAAIGGRLAGQAYSAQRRVLERVREAWIARRRLMTEIVLADAPRGADAAAKAVQQELRLDELTAQLDAATGGAFSANTRNTTSQKTVSAEDSR